MVENFTNIQEKAYCEVEEPIVQIDEVFETNVRHHMQYLAKEPRQHIIDDILNYSKSLRKA